MESVTVMESRPDFIDFEKEIIAEVKKVAKLHF